jgi:hypothetical protein
VNDLKNPVASQDIPFVYDAGQGHWSCTDERIALKFCITYVPESSGALYRKGGLSLENPYSRKLNIQTGYIYKFRDWIHEGPKNCYFWNDKGFHSLAPHGVIKRTAFPLGRRYIYALERPGHLFRYFRSWKELEDYFMDETDDTPIDFFEWYPDDKNAFPFYEEREELALLIEALKSHDR